MYLYDSKKGTVNYTLWNQIDFSDVSKKPLRFLVKDFFTIYVILPSWS